MMGKLTVALGVGLTALPVALGFGSCSAGPVGSCAIVGCYPSRGPTKCMGNSCMCADGYCEAGSALKECRAQVGTCNMLPCNPMTHGGVLATECINGFCLCHTGYHANADGLTCDRGWWPASATGLASVNKTMELRGAAVPLQLEEVNYKSAVSNGHATWKEDHEAWAKMSDTQQGKAQSEWIQKHIHKIDDSMVLPVAAIGALFGVPVFCLIAMKLSKPTKGDNTSACNGWGPCFLFGGIVCVLWVYLAVVGLGFASFKAD